MRQKIKQKLDYVSVREMRRIDARDINPTPSSVVFRIFMIFSSIEKCISLIYNCSTFIKMVQPEIL